METDFSFLVEENRQMRSDLLECKRAALDALAEVARMHEDNIRLRRELISVTPDAQRYRYLQSIPVVDAQAFFWLYPHRKGRNRAIDAARN